MAATIRIEVDVYLVTVRVEAYRIVEEQVRVGRGHQIRRVRRAVVDDLVPGYSRQDISRAFQAVNQIFTLADIQFGVRSLDAQRVRAPGNRAVVNEEGFVFLTSRFPSRGAVSLLLVKDFESRETGGQAIEERGVCIVKKLSATGFVNVLAHELGHLLALPHVEPGNADANYNLMYPALRAGNRLTAEQIQRARQSPLGTNPARTPVVREP